MKVLALLLSLSLLVITHEFGHLGFAKLFHTRVRRFYLFFNWKFSILKAKKFNGKWHFLFFNATTPDSWLEENLPEEDRDNTLWGIGWIPLGGYCDIAGMVDETKSADDLEAEPQPWEYRTKPAWQRLCIISGGVLVNFLSALLIYTCIFAHWGSDELPLQNVSLGYEYHQILRDEGLENGDIIYDIDGVEVSELSDAQQRLLFDNPKTVSVLRDDSLHVIHTSGRISERVNAEQPKDGLITGVRMPFVVKDYAPGSVAAKAGILPGDSVIGICDSHMVVYSQIVQELASHAGDTISVRYVRQVDGEEKVLESTIQLPSDGKMGVQLKSPYETYSVEHTDYNFLQAIPKGISHGWNTLTSYVSSLKILFTKNGTQNLGGFVTMGSIFPSEWQWYSFWNITALLAIILAFMNVIPIPGLDGAYIVFTLWEIITRRKPSDKFLEVANTIGWIIILLLLVVANGNDIWRLIRGM